MNIDERETTRCWRLRFSQWGWQEEQEEVEEEGREEKRRRKNNNQVQEEEQGKKKRTTTTTTTTRTTTITTTTTTTATTTHPWCSLPAAPCTCDESHRWVLPSLTSIFDWLHRNYKRWSEMIITLPGRAGREGWSSGCWDHHQYVSNTDKATSITQRSNLIFQTHNNIRYTAWSSHIEIHSIITQQ